MSFTLTKLPQTKEEEAEEFTLIKKGEEPTKALQTVRGAAQGGLDVGTLASLPLYPLEKGVQKIFGTSDYEGLSPQAEAKFSGEADVLERVRNEGYAPSMQELMDLSEDYLGYGPDTSLAAIHGMQKDIPEGGVYQEGVRRVTRSLPAAAFGALPGVLGAEFTGLAAKESVAALGGGETAQTIADIAGGLAYGLKGLFSKAATGEKLVPAVAQREGGILQAIEKQAPASLEKRVHSLGKEVIKDFNKAIGDIADTEIQNISNFSARQIEDAIVKDANAKILNKITPQDQLPQQAWKDIQEGANSLYEAEKSLYTAKYARVRDAAAKMEIKPKQSIDMARNVLKKLTNVKTSPTGYSQTANIVRDVLHDLTGVSPSAEVIKSAMETGNTTLLNAIYESLTDTTKLKADKLMDLSIRLNDAINYETLIPNIKNFLKPLQKTIKNELKDTLQSRSPKLFKEFEQADRLYQRTADRFGKDVITKMRSSETPEKMNAVFSEPSNFENLVQLFGKNSPQVKSAERQIISEMGSTGTKSAQNTFRQLEPFLSTEAKEAGKEIIALGDNLSVAGQRRALQKSMLEDVAESISTGSPPNFTTRAMMTPEGYRTAKATFDRSASGREVFKSLEKKLVSDIFDPIFMGDQVDWAKAAQIMDNPNTAVILNEIMGPEGVGMVRNMQQYGKNITANLASMKQNNPTSFNKLITKMDSPTKLMLAAVVGKALAMPLWLVGAAGALSLKRVVASAITNPKVLRAMKELGNASVLAPALSKDINIINQNLSEDLM